MTNHAEIGRGANAQKSLHSLFDSSLKITDYYQTFIFTVKCLPRSLKLLPCGLFRKLALLFFPGGMLQTLHPVCAWYLSCALTTA